MNLMDLLFFSNYFLHFVLISQLNNFFNLLLLHIPVKKQILPCQF